MKRATNVRGKRQVQGILDRVPVAETNLTPAERKLLADPDWVTEDDADVVIAMRRLRKEKSKGVPLEMALKRYGYRVEGHRVAGGPKRTRRVG